jgi:hypothetical protein
MNILPLALLLMLSRKGGGGGSLPWPKPPGQPGRPPSPPGGGGGGGGGGGNAQDNVVLTPLPTSGNWRPHPAPIPESVIFHAKQLLGTLPKGKWELHGGVIYRHEKHTPTKWGITAYVRR